MARPNISAAKIERAKAMKEAGAGLAEVMAAVGYSQQTLYNHGLTWGNRQHAPEVIEQVRQLYIVQGLPGTDVAKRMGLASRNAVIGIADRNGMVRSPTVRAINQKRSVGKPKVKAPPKPVVIPTPAVVIDFAPRPFVERKSSECAWPVTDCEPWFVCGGTVGTRGPYCSAHADIAYSPAKVDAKDLARYLRRHLG